MALTLDPSKRNDIIIRQGQSLNFSFLLTNESDGEDFAVAGYTFNLEIYDRRRAKIFDLTDGEGLTVQDGSVAVSISANDLNIPDGDYKYFLVVTNPDAETNTWINGYAKVKDSLSIGSQDDVSVTVSDADNNVNITISISGSTLSADDYWKTSGITTYTGDVDIQGGNSLTLSNSQNNSIDITQGDIIITTDVGQTTISSLIGLPARYNGNYTPQMTNARDIPDIGYNDAHYWKTSGMTNLTGPVIIQPDAELTFIGQSDITFVGETVGLFSSEDVQLGGKSIDINGGNSLGDNIVLRRGTSSSFTINGDGATFTDMVAQYESDYTDQMTTARHIPDVGYIESNFYTQTNLQTSGQAQVHWDNITDTPTILDEVIVEMGGWNMDTDGDNHSVAHGLPDHTKIRGHSIIIRNDAGNIYTTGEPNEAYIVGFTSTNISLQRLSGGIYDNPNYSDDQVNRGWILLKLAP